MEGEEKFGPVLSRLYSVFAPFFAGRLYRVVLEEVHKLRPASLLDVGCGPGIAANLIASRIKGIEVYCVDPSESMVEIAKRRTIKNNLSGRVTSLRGSSRSLPFDRKFDMVITSLSFHHWKDREESLAYLLKKLNNNGVLAIFEMNADSMGGIYRAGRSHSLTGEYAKSLVFNGFSREIKILGNGRILEIQFRKDA